MKPIVFVLLSITMSAADLPYRDPGIGKVVQIAIVCKDVEACAQRWSQLLGKPAPPARTTVSGQEAKVTYHGEPSNGQAKLTFFDVGQGLTLELIQPVGPATSWKEYLDRSGEGVHHIAFKVRNLEKTIESFNQQGMPLIQRGRFDKNNGDYCYMDSQDNPGVAGRSRGQGG
jgi:methylmalonyl-CoA/ethylmalonyl-CoA epimerase